MFANVLNTLAGLYLAYLSIFGSAAGTARWHEAAAGLAIILLALLARRSDFSGWQSSTNAALGGFLLVAMLVNWVVPINALVMFWIDLWVGLIVACLALWAALYHPEPRLAAARLVPEVETGMVGDEAGRPGG